MGVPRECGDKEEMRVARRGFLPGMAYKVRSSQQAKVRRLWLAGAVMPSAKLICLSFIGQSRPQGKVSWFSLPSEKAQSLPRAEVSSSAPPLLLQTTDHPGTGLGVGWVIGQWLRWGLCSKPVLSHKLEKEQTSAQCLRSSAVSTAGDGDLLPQMLLPLSAPPAPLPVVAPIIQVLGGQMGAAERPAGLGEDDHRFSRTSSTEGRVRLAVGGRHAPLPLPPGKKPAARQRQLTCAGLPPPSGKGWEESPSNL